jgi:hypothetical protein
MALHDFGFQPKKIAMNALSTGRRVYIWEKGVSNTLKSIPRALLKNTLPSEFGNKILFPPGSMKSLAVSPLSASRLAKSNWNFSNQCPKADLELIELPLTVFER